MGKLTISMAMFNSYVKLPEGTPIGVAAESWGSHGCQGTSQVLSGAESSWEKIPGSENRTRAIDTWDM
jgi:hypothetical protein